jgi:signal transduction histidine kinase
MFQQARRRLTGLYIVLFALVLVVFSVVFYVGFITVLEPAFDIAPELSNTQAAELAYGATIQRIAVALAIADLAAIAVVGAAAWILANRTLEPIREAHQRQQRFIADASHEIRNPLAATKSSAQAALTPNATPAQLRAALETVVESTDRLTRLANDLLTLARSSTVLSGERDRCDLSVVVAEAVEAYLVSEPRRQAVRATFAPDLPVAADPGDIGRIVRNLVENAVRHGGPQAQVTVVTRSSDREAILDVTDDGPGIAAADIPQIFEPFHRLQAHAGAEGTGLGLAIAADLAARNGGRLAVRSVAGSGSTFSLVLPRLR